MLIDQYRNEPGQTLVRQPVIQRRRQQRSLIGGEYAECLVHRAASASRNACLPAVQDLPRTIHHRRVHQPPIIPRTRSPADHPARRVAYPGSTPLPLLSALQAQRRGIADSKNESREAEARKDLAFNSVDKFRNTATSPRPGAPRVRRHRPSSRARTAVTPMALHETVIGDLNLRIH
jgi:hypothetical protein